VTRRELRAIEAVIEWAVAPAAPLPAVRETDAVAAFEQSVSAGPVLQRWALRATLALVGPRAFGRWILRTRLAPLGELLAGLAQLAYYGDVGVSRLLGYDAARAAA
jgi:hypothetical protein